MNAELEKLLEKPTASVPAVGRVLGMSRNTAYAAVRNGTFPFPTIVAGHGKRAARSGRRSAVTRTPREDIDARVSRPPTTGPEHPAQVR
jgi:hypothetical protein